MGGSGGSTSSQKKDNDDCGTIFLSLKFESLGELVPDEPRLGQGKFAKMIA